MSRRKQVAVSLDDDVLAYLERRAEEERSTLSQLLRSIVSRAVQDDLGGNCRQLAEVAK